MTSDQTLIRRSARGDRAAFAELFDRHSAAVFGYGFARMDDADDAQDLVQETFLTAWRRIGELRLVGESALPWLLVTCRNHAANLRRSKAVRTAFALIDADRPVEDGTLARLEDQESLRWVLDEISRLNDTDRRIMELCLLEHRSYQEAADLVDVSVTSLTKKIQRFRARLRAARDVQEGEARA